MRTISLSREIGYQMIKEENAGAAGTERLISATAGSRPVRLLGFSARPVELCFADLSSSGLYAARLVIILLDKILSTIESNC